MTYTQLLRSIAKARKLYEYSGQASSDKIDKIENFVNAKCPASTLSMAEKREYVRRSPSSGRVYLQLA